MTTTFPSQAEPLVRSQTAKEKSRTQSARMIELQNRAALNMLPPEVEGPNFGSLFVEMQAVEWLTYDGENYLEEGLSTAGKGLTHLFANLKFWGDRTKGIYLKMANGMKKAETVTNKFRYDVKCPEKSFEKYLDDMGVLVVDFFDTERNQNIGTSKIMLKLYIKRVKKEGDDQPLIELRGSFPITLTGNQNVKIGQFGISIVSSFALPDIQFKFKLEMNKKNRQPVNLDDSFEENERKAQYATQQDKNRRLIENAFSDDRVPSSYQGQKTNSAYKSKDFYMNDEVDELPTRDRPRGNQQERRDGKENQRNLINIDENEETFSSQAEFDRIFARGEKLKQQMNQALDADTAWQTLHGHYELPKKYVPPFLKEEAKEEDSELDHIYAVEVEGSKLRESQELKAGPKQSDTSDLQRQDTQHIRDMKFIRIKIGALRIEDETLLHELIESTFTTTVSVPLPDVYQKKVSHQLVKLNNYEVVSFNEFAFNSLSLYNFRVDEDTYQSLITAQLVVSIDGKNVVGQVSMLKLLMSKAYKLQVTVPLHQTVVVVDETQKKRQQSQEPSKKGGKKPEPPRKREEVKIQPSTFQKQVGSITLELQLQRGDSESELARDYQLKLKQIEEEKTKEDARKQAEIDKYMKFSHQQDPVFAQIYINIKSVRNLSLNPDGSLNKNLHEESSMQRLGLERQEEGSEQKQQEAQRRNLFVQYKAFPALEKLKTNTVWQEQAPSFQYRAQFPVVMNPETMLKLQNFTFVLEVWDVKSPAQEEFIGLVKVPLASFCYSMKTTDDQIFSLNFLADQHCMYPMMICDGYLPIYSPRLGLNIGELALTMAMGTALQINRQIQKEQDQDQHLMEMTYKAKIAEMMKKQSGEDNLLRAQLEMSTKLQLDLQQQKLDQEKRQQEELERSANAPLQDQLFSGFNSMINKQGGSPSKQEGIFKNIGNFLRQSLNASTRDVDMRKLSMLSSMRKLFEEARFLDLKELNGEELFPMNAREFDGQLKKDQFVYFLSQKAEFTLTRTEIANLQTLMTSISRNDSSLVDVDELQKSYQQYLRDYDSVQQEVIELLQLFKRLIDKKFEDSEALDDFLRVIEERAQESKLPVMELKDLLGSYDVRLRDSCYDQLAGYFDLDRNDQIHIVSFCEFMRSQQAQKLNFLKVHPSVFTNRIVASLKELLCASEDSMQMLENEFKIETAKLQGKSANLEDITEDILLTERINAKLFLSKVRRVDTSVTLWEVFCLFEHLNTNQAKLFYEPQRYHQILFAHLFKFATGSDYDQKVQLIIERKQRQLEEQRRKEEEAQNMLKASTESIFALAHDINKRGESDDGIYSSKGDLQSQMSEEEQVVVKKKGKRKKKEMTFVNKHELDSSEDEQDKRDVSVQLSKARTATLGDEDKPYKKVKHVFEVKVKELLNIPLLDKLVKDFQRNEQAENTLLADRATQKSKFKQKQSDYIQNVGVKYSFPLDDEQVFQSDYIQLDAEALAANNQFNYKVSINTVHNYVINKEDSIQTHLLSAASSDQLFNITLAIFEGSKEYVIGNAQIPIEDIIDQIELHSVSQDKATLSRILFIYGTSFTQRENCIIGKLHLEINYKTEKQFLACQKEGSGEQESEDLQTCFLHKETYVKRKIPLNGVISVHVESIQNIKESIENIEHFARIQQSALSQDSQAKSSKLSSMTGGSKKSVINDSREAIDRRRILAQIFKTGLNIVVVASVFGDDVELARKFPQGQHTSRLLYNTLNPIFNESFDINLQMDTKLFEYLNNKKARFEVRHYLVGSKEEQSNSVLSRMKVQREQPSNRSGITEDSDESTIFESCDYVVIGQATVPLRNLLASNVGVDDSFTIFDDYKQQMGQLRLRIALNHHSQNRPLYSLETQQHKGKADSQLRTTMIDKCHTQSLSRSQNGLSRASDHQLILGINFVELVFKNKEQLLQQAQLSKQIGQVCYLYLKFQVLGQNYQTKFLCETQKQNQYLKQLRLSVFEIKKTVLVQLDLLNARNVEEAFANPLEVQLWFKKEATQKYQQPDEELLLGSFFVEINELSKIRNRRIKEQAAEQQRFQSYEGYFSLYEREKDNVGLDRLGCRLFLIRQEYDSQLADAEVLFHNLEPINSQIQSTLDPQLKGFIDYEDLLGLLQRELQDPQLSILKQLTDCLEYKNSEKVFYSPLFGPLPPYFRLLKKFDSFGIVEKFNREFHGLDHQNSGFLPLALFRSLLEHELKIKEKIVVDFVKSMREVDAQQNLQTLDVNVTSHSLKHQIDYVVLLRKLAQYFEAKHLEKSGLSDRTQAEEAAADKADGDEVTLRIDIESACKLKNPNNELELPNGQVVLRLPFQNCRNGVFETQVVSRNEYPNWQLRGQQASFQISSENLRILVHRPLEFEVYHFQNFKSQSSQQLIGVAYVDLSLMVFVDGIYQIAGYFHILNKDKFNDGHSVPLLETKVLQSHSLGQLKLSIQTSTNIRRLTQLSENSRAFIRENSPLKENGYSSSGFNAFQSYQPTSQPPMTMSFNKENNLLQMSETQQKLMQSFDRFNVDLSRQRDDQLKEKLSQNMSDLEELLSTLKTGKLASSSQLEDNKEQMFEREVSAGLQRRAEVFDQEGRGQLGETHGYNQSYQLVNQFAQLTSDLKQKNERLQQMREQDRVQQVQANNQAARILETEEESELERDEQMQPSYNVFSHTAQPLQNQLIEQESLGEFKEGENKNMERNEEDPLRQSFSPLNFQYSQNILRDQVPSQPQLEVREQPIIPPLQISNVFERMNLQRDVLSESDRFQEERQRNPGLFQSQSQDQLFQMASEDNQPPQNFGMRSGHFKEESKREEFQVENEPVRDSGNQTAKKRSIFREDDDKEMDAKEFQRLQRIMGSKK